MEIVKNSVIKFSNKKHQKLDNLLLIDLDGTLIKTKSGNKFPKDASDWEFANDISKLPRRNYEIIIISNQLRAASKNSLTRRHLVAKIPAVMRKCGINTAYILVANDSYRKPATSLLEDFIEPHKYKEVIYVGDAAGRYDDHSDSDYLFAINYNILRGDIIKFMTPEQFFKKSYFRATINRDFYPPIFFSNIRAGRNLNNIKYDIDEYKINEPECVYICGPPSCGKSTLSKRIKAEWNYIRISRRANGKLRKHKSYVIDINPVADIDFIYNHEGKVRVFILLENGYYTNEMKSAISKSCIIARKKMSRSKYNKTDLNVLNNYYNARSFPRKKKWSVINIDYDITNIKSETHFKYLMQYY